ncbi:hypothetical protein BOX15_Mlig022452g1 [Macrostomum lignano]|nr:hypothetical protein BOX15_Mlig022452g1 [Macrostomum lignano]
MRTISQRLRLVSNGPVAFCLDGFYHGAAEFGNIFGEDVAPKMLLTPGATPAGLRLCNGDNIFMSVQHSE